jgi:hypothetical protein
VSPKFFIDIKSYRSYYDPGIDLASNRTEYQEYFLGVKSGRCVSLTTLPPSCAVVTKSGSLNFLEPCGPVQACNGTAFNVTVTTRTVIAGTTHILTYPKYGQWLSSLVECCCMLTRRTVRSCGSAFC